MSGKPRKVPSQKSPEIKMVTHKVYKEIPEIEMPIHEAYLELLSSYPYSIQEFLLRNILKKIEKDGYFLPMTDY